ncbi:MAG: ATP-binding cassette domain-containing protein [Anaerolineae bacterium]|nr:ATP-binding cassette domain-containing protein [Anaerolineae bacterium]
MDSVMIQTRDLTRRFGDITAVQELGLNVPRGSIYGFLGHNGAGKTTTIRMLLGLIRPDAGEITLAGQALDSNPLSLLRQIGALVESPSCYPHLTGYENLELTRRLLGIPEDNIDRVLATVKLEHAAHRLVRGYSHGMKQRLGLALALLGKPQLLILDEPTNGLDPAGIREIRSLIKELPAEYGTTVFLSSHLLDEIQRVVTHIGIIHRGRLVFEGSLAELEAQQQAHIRLGVNRPDRAAQLLKQAGYAVRAVDGNMLSIEAAAHDETAAINSLLVGEGLVVNHLALHVHTLEDIFLDLTQAHAGEGAGS